MIINAFANPQRFMALSRVALPLCAWIGTAVAAIGLVWGLFYAPPDYLQGDTARIMFVHVPAAWLSMGLYLGLVISSIVVLIWRHSLADVAAAAIAPVGAVFAAIVLATGAIWGKPMWGAFWVWDARLTSMLVLLLVYLGLMALRAMAPDPQSGSRLCAILAVAGVVNLVIVKFSVDWWATQHQPASVFRMDGPTMHISMLLPLLVTWLGSLLVAAALVMARMRIEVHERRAQSAWRKRARAAGDGSAAPAAEFEGAS